MGGHVSTSKQKKIGRTDGHENPTPKVVNKNKMTSKLLKNKFVVESHSILSAGMNGQNSGVERPYDGGRSCTDARDAAGEVCVVIFPVACCRDRRRRCRQARVIFPT